jgi:hypothetical protein
MPDPDPAPTVEPRSTDELRRVAELNAFGTDPGLVFATLYVGDQIRRIADAVDRDVAAAPPPLLPSGRLRIAAAAATLADHADEVAAGLELRDDALVVAIRPVTDAIRELADVVEAHAAAPGDTAHPPF